MDELLMRNAVLMTKICPVAELSKDDWFVHYRAVTITKPSILLRHGGCCPEHRLLQSFQSSHSLA